MGGQRPLVPTVVVHDVDLAPVAAVAVGGERDGGQRQARPGGEVADDLVGKRVSHAPRHRERAAVPLAENEPPSLELRHPAFDHQPFALDRDLGVEQQLVAKRLIELRVGRLIAGQAEDGKLFRALHQEDPAALQIGAQGLLELARGGSGVRGEAGRAVGRRVGEAKLGSLVGIEHEKEVGVVFLRGRRGEARDAETRRQRGGEHRSDGLGTHEVLSGRVPNHRTASLTPSESALKLAGRGGRGAAARTARRAA